MAAEHEARAAATFLSVREKTGSGPALRCVERCSWSQSHALQWKVPAFGKMCFSITSSSALSEERAELPLAVPASRAQLPCAARGEASASSARVRWLQSTLKKKIIGLCPPSLPSPAVVFHGQAALCNTVTTGSLPLMRSARASFLSLSFPEG